jgi:hypothetical protein
MRKVSGLAYRGYFALNSAPAARIPHLSSEQRPARIAMLGFVPSITVNIAL